MSKQIPKQLMFPSKLQEILDNEESNQFIEWGQDKECIKINDVKGFQENVLPLYFRHNNFDSFSRQMNLYGFKKNRNSTIQIFTNEQLRKGKKLIQLQSRSQKKRQKYFEEQRRLERVNEQRQQKRFSPQQGDANINTQNNNQKEANSTIQSSQINMPILYQVPMINSPQIQFPSGNYPYYWPQFTGIDSQAWFGVCNSQFGFLQ